MSSPRRRPRSSAASPLNDEDLLAEILLRLPPAALIPSPRLRRLQVLAQPCLRPRLLPPVASVYSSVTGVWDNLVSTPLPPEDSGFPTMVYTGMPAVMVGGSFYWLLYGNSGILEFDLDKLSLSCIPMPVGNTREGNIWVMPAECGGLGLLFLKGFCAQLWKMKTDSKGVSSWVLGRSVDLDKLLSLNSEMERECPRIVGFALDNNVVLLWTSVGIFTVHFESLQFKEVFESHDWYRCYPFEGVYTADRGIGRGPSGAKLLYNT